MDLPRFTTGNLGRLTFKDVNALCDVAERANEFLRTVTRQNRNEPVKKEIFAVLLGYAPSPAVTGAILFHEVELERSIGAPPHWVPRWNPRVYAIKSGDISSNGVPNQDFQPCFFLQRNLIQQNARFGTPYGIARLQWVNAENGLGCWFVVGQEQRASTFPAEIVQTYPSLHYPMRWRYFWRERRRTAADTFADTYEDFNEQFIGGIMPSHPLSIDLGTARNGAEFTTAVPIVPSTATLTRNPIPIGTIVQMSLDNYGIPFFCQANSYTVTCTP